VALKIAHRDLQGDTSAAILLHEAKAAAALRHPGIVSVFEIGREDNRTFIVQEMIVGQTLEDWMKCRRPTFRETARICRSIAHALHYAHERGIVHRDVKPTNILVDASDTPHVTDFGLAKRASATTTVAANGKILGTPAFMSPEQAAGEADVCDCRSDVYSLGVVMYQLLTDELPFRGDVASILHQVLHEEPSDPTRLKPLLPRDLATIVLKSMERAATSRYQDAGQLADDLNRYLAGEPIQARPISRVKKAWRRCCRDPLPYGLGLSLFLALTFGLIGVTTQWFRANEAQEQAEELAKRESASKEEAVSALYASRMNLIDNAWRRLQCAIGCQDGELLVLDEAGRHAIPTIQRHHVLERDFHAEFASSNAG
jgi:serine/threonine protein kinase